MWFTIPFALFIDDDTSAVSVNVVRHVRAAEL